jgi:hypothetical protein
MADAWGENNWGEGFWGQQSSITATVTGVESSFTLANAGHTGTALINPTGAEAPTEVGQAIGEAESIYPLTGVQSNTSTGTLTVGEGHGVQPTGVEMSFADGTETVITTVDAGWGRNTWGSFEWGLNIEVFGNVTGEQMTFGQSNVDVFTGTGIVANATGIEMSTDLGTTTQTTDQILSVTGINIQSSAALATIIADGSVTTSAPADIMDMNVGSVSIEIFTQVDPTSVTSTFDIGTVVAPAAALPTGEEISTNIGDVVIPITVAGLSMQFDDGTANAVGSAIVTPTGVEMSVIVGNMRSTPWANVVTGASNTWTEVAA